MPSFQQYQSGFVQALVSTSSPRVEEASAGMLPDLLSLLDGLPCYGNQAFEAAHRGALATLLEINLPNDAIAAQPNTGNGNWGEEFTYAGSYSGYRDAFFGQLNATTASSKVAAAVTAVNGSLGPGWWGGYGVAALTDAIRQKASVSLDTGKLSGDLSSYNSSLLPALTASVLAVLQVGYAPVSGPLAALQKAGETAAALGQLQQAIAQGLFTANINQAISAGGDQTSAATWFLYELWMVLRALGLSDVDTAISTFQKGGLTVPAEVGPKSWWDGGYTSWFDALSGSDVLAQAAAAIALSMPEHTLQYTLLETGRIVYHGGSANPPNGYALSLCAWGSLAHYVPQSSSCLGRGTGVLMADGGVRLIEEIKIGDLVLTDRGARRVALVETPARAGRALYRVNGLDVWATAGHPFRTASQGCGPLRRAVDPWELIDVVPTMVERGVGALRVGSTLAGWCRGEARAVPVASVEVAEAGGPDDERVYDLLLERWELDHPAWYVGGPELFLAVDAESADPLYDLPATAGVLSAMEVALEPLRRLSDDPARRTLELLGGLDPSTHLPAARRAAWTIPDGKLPRPRVPGPETYLDGERWSSHASILEYQLVRRFGRLLRREGAMGWRDASRGASADAVLAVTVHDVELLGDVEALRAPVSLELRLRGVDPGGDRVEVLKLPVGVRPSWHLLPDAVVALGACPAEPASLLGRLSAGGRTVGSFRATVGTFTLDAPASEHLLFGPDGRAIGRVALETRRMTRAALAAEAERGASWDRRRAVAMARSLGRQVGWQLRARLEGEAPFT